jgi:hypothetical protein
MAGNPSWRGRINTVDLLVLTSLDQLTSKSKKCFTFATKQDTLMRRSTVLSHPLQLVFPGHGHVWLCVCVVFINNFHPSLIFTIIATSSTLCVGGGAYYPSSGVSLVARFIQLPPSPQILYLGGNRGATTMSKMTFSIITLRITKSKSRHSA